MRKLFAHMAGFVVFLAAWTILGKFTSGLVFPELSAQLGPGISPVMALGALVGVISFLVQGLVVSAITGEK